MNPSPERHFLQDYVHSLWRSPSGFCAEAHAIAHRRSSIFTDLLPYYSGHGILR